MEECAANIIHPVKIKEKIRQVDLKNFATPKKIGGTVIFTYPVFPLLGANKVDICDLKQVYTDHDDWENFPKTGAPFSGGPRNQPTERITRFGANITDSDFKALLRILEIEENKELWHDAYNKSYAVVYHEALHPKTAGYLAQMRIISESLLRYDFFMPAAFSSLPKQPITANQLLLLFIEQERSRYKWRQNDGQPLRGVFADPYFDGHLRFGIMKEDSAGGVLRIFSDAYLTSPACEDAE